MSNFITFFTTAVAQQWRKAPQLFIGLLTLIFGGTGLLYGLYLCVNNNHLITSAIHPRDSSSENSSSFTQQSSISSNSGVVVDVSGAVKNPGLYELPSDARIFNALEKAGGLTPAADSDFIQKQMNLAEKVKEGQKIYFQPSQNQTDTQENSSSQIDVSEELVSINFASAKALETLPGIGEKLAEKIVGGRPYQNIEELSSRIKIGPTVFEKLKDLVKI